SNWYRQRCRSRSVGLSMGAEKRRNVLRTSKSRFMRYTTSSSARSGSTSTKDTSPKRLNNLAIFSTRCCAPYDAPKGQWEATNSIFNAVLTEKFQQPADLLSIPGQSFSFTQD